MCGWKSTTGVDKLLEIITNQQATIHRLVSGLVRPSAEETARALMDPLVLKVTKNMWEPDEEEQDWVAYAEITPGRFVGIVNEEDGDGTQYLQVWKSLDDAMSDMENHILRPVTHYIPIKRGKDNDR